MNGAVIYNGPSKLDGKPIIGIVTGMKGNSSNPKTGGIAQLWVLREDIHPAEALQTGEDESICGGCVHRGQVDENGETDGNTCYVRLMGPISIWNAYHRGSYPTLTPREVSDLLASRDVELRLGAYGDPVALPVPVLRGLCHSVTGWTGYTHQWRKAHRSYRRWLMASTDSIAETDLARSNGWRTFRIRLPGELPIAGEIDCPASPVSGHRLQCQTCMICNGCGPNDTPGRVSVSIVAHGVGTGIIERRNQ